MAGLAVNENLFSLRSSSEDRFHEDQQKGRAVVLSLLGVRAVFVFWVNIEDRGREGRVQVLRRCYLFFARLLLEL